MSKIRFWTFKDTQEGKDLLQSAFESKDQVKLDQFYSWIECNVLVNPQIVRKAFDLTSNFGDLHRAERLYDAMMDSYNPIEIVTIKIIKILLMMVVALGMVWIICDILYKLRMLFIP